VVTPDAQRTMSTYLGISDLLGPDDIDPDLIAAADVTFLEGYLFDRAEAQEAYWRASRLAHDAGRQVALTLSDTFCVERHKEAWRMLVRDEVDILFANEHEAVALYEVDTVAAAVAAVQQDDVAVAAITLGAAGSLVVSGDDVTEVAAHPVPAVLDTTGAGDQYAAGFLFGFTSGRTLDECGRLGSAAASSVLGHTGPRPRQSLAELATALGF
jgi:sugar/nucleoside kinase (ribokinase family)